MNDQVLAVRIGGKNIYEWTQMSVVEAIDFIEHLELTPAQRKIAELGLNEIKNRLTFLKNVGLTYLTLEPSGVDSFRRRKPAYSSGHPDCVPV